MKMNLNWRWLLRLNCRKNQVGAKIRVHGALITFYGILSWQKSVGLIPEIHHPKFYSTWPLGMNELMFIVSYMGTDFGVTVLQLNLEDCMLDVYHTIYLYNK